MIMKWWCRGCGASSWGCQLLSSMLVCLNLQIFEPIMLLLGSSGALDGDSWLVLLFFFSLKTNLWKIALWSKTFGGRADMTYWPMSYFAWRRRGKKSPMWQVSSLLIPTPVYVVKDEDNEVDLSHWDAILLEGYWWRRFAKIQRLFEWDH